MDSKMTVKGQVTIPKEMRDYLGLQPGDTVRFVYLEDGGVRLQADRRRRPGTPRSRFESLRGRAGKGPRTEELMRLLRGYDEDAKDPGFSR